ncbi:MBL fold metallo-hydrolase [Veillonella intestinalis]|uniref:MBL fold metallo-hydrolase n=1 Tax=Veillonella intestinalis TaxID=2941341 RepID=UPI00203D3790|nr:MBL fold metallo-hydrolase [Veillonella intestinalis]
MRQRAIEEAVNKLQMNITQMAPSEPSEVSADGATLAAHVLASGSQGNATLITYKDTCILVDAGISARRITQGIKELGLRLDQLAGICITHEHTDHMAGLPQLLKQCDVPVYTRAGTMREIVNRKGIASKAFTVITKNSFTLGDLQVDTFRTSHDAADPMGLCCYGGNHKITFMTDTGIVDDTMLKHMDYSNLLVLEANYDPQMLKYGPYPYDLKQRVASPYGHLSNEHAAQALLMMKRPDNLQVILAHRSEKNNAQPVVDDTVMTALQAEGLQVNKDICLYHGQPKEKVSIHA